ncbi:MAG: metallophosphoesterase, partial [Proteobacteria bacterium]|nr:metallophosphoesterase [Pseudomonadota bacterium]
KWALSFGRGVGILLIAFMVTMIFSPMLVRVLERHGFEFLPRVIAYVGYIWMGLLFLFVSTSLILDIYHLLIYLIGLLLPKGLSMITLSAQHLFYAALVVSTVVTAYGLFEAMNIRIEQVTVRSPKISEKLGRLRVVQISDVHLGVIVREARLKRILEKVREAQPDILVSTGDLLDGQIDNISLLADMLRDVKTRYGKFAVIGNHEYYAGLDRSLDFTKRAGFSILRNEGLELSGLINIAGVDDPAGRRFGLLEAVSEKQLLSTLPRENFTLFLKHRPLLDNDAAGLFDLQLSGHSHKGQIFPFTLFIRPLYPIAAGLLRLGDGSSLYVSRGTGTWGPPIRFLAPPEVTVVDLVHEKGIMR